ncbi:Discolored-paralog2 [Zea mays]|uniref:Discolored-paralog2 n=1 Tax=Zea mays TaxID=4577 RepID=A0A1D6KKF9_MAIZE|nr:Discolored-paralog2 [Zea mays]ONM03412.1 Discolored-paralog2 [Zea mays]
MYFAKLDDSPMFRTQIQSLEESAELLRERCLKFHKGCRKYTEGLGEAYDGDIAFASSLETFGGGHNDPMSVAFGGPVMTKFTIALREIGTYKEVLRSQVEHMLNDRLLNFVDIDLHDVKDAHKRFDKASLSYDQIREKYLSLKKGTRPDITTAIEDELHSARSSFEQARFNLVTSLSHVEAKKRFEFLEAVSATMDSHLRYFKQGYELLHQMEPYINQILAYAQQSRERANKEQASLVERMHEYKRQIDRESRSSINGLNDSYNGDRMQTIGRSSHKQIEAVMQSTSKGKAESAVDQMDWIEKITGVIASLLSSQSPEQCFMSSPKGSGHDRSTSDGSSFTSSVEFEPSVIDDLVLEKYSGNGQHDVIRGTHHHRTSMKPEKPIDLLRKVDGNNMCADCGALEPDWASLNLGALLCIECSGVHRNLGVHISKVRSLTLDVRVWEPSVINLFQSLGNMFVNNIWEDMLPDDNSSADGSDTSQYLSVSKPKHKDVFSAKEKFIHAKYVDKEFIRKRSMDENQLAEQMWNSVAANDKKTAYSLIVRSRANVNLVYGEMPSSPFLTLGKALQQEQPVSPPDGSPKFFDCNSHDKISPREPLSPASTSSRTDDMEDGCEGLSLLHLACRVADVGMVELLLQYGASVNMNDSRGRTPLHHCILKGRHRHAKLLLSRGADSQAMDRDGRTALQYAIDGGTSDEDILALLEDHSR